MSTHRKLSARAFHPLRILIALALSVAVLPFMAGPSYADEEVVEEETIVETELETRDLELDSVGVGEENGGEVLLVPEAPDVDVQTPAQPKQTEEELQSGAVAEDEPLLVALSDMVGPLVDEPCVLPPGSTFGEYPDPDSVAEPPTNTTFEIDGNTVECEFDDWDGVGTKIPDGLDDDTNFQGSSKEFEHPSGWVIGPSLTAADKADIRDVWIYNPEPGPGQDTFSYFAFSRGFTNGTTSYDVEYNQKENTVGNLPRPNRTPGDLLIQLDQQGSPGYNFVITGAWVWQLADIKDDSDEFVFDNPDWNETDCRDPKESGYDPPASWCALEDPEDHFKGKVSKDQDGWEDGEFAEGGVNITKIFGDTTCIGDFGVMNIRSRSSNSADSALKDWVAPQAVEIQGTCQDLYIEKVDADDHADHIGFATFEITPDPRPGGEADSVFITDNVDAADIAAAAPGVYPGNQVGDEDPAAGYLKISQIEPGTYVITETEAPDDYFMAPPPETGEDCPAVATAPLTVNCGTVTITTSDGKVVFQDKKIWEAPTVSKTAAGSYDTAYDWDIEKTVSESDDEENPDDKARQDIAEGGSATFYYGVTVTGTETKSNYEVTGTVTVTNPNEDSMTVTLDDVVGNGEDSTDNVVCDFDADNDGAGDGDADGGSFTVDLSAAEDGPDEFAYTCTLTESDADAVNTNTVTVSWDSAEYTLEDPQSPGQPLDMTGYEWPSDDATFAFAANEGPDKVVDVEDQYAEFGGPYEVEFGEVLAGPEPPTASQNGNTYTWFMPYSKSFGGTAGECDEHENTAWVDLDGDGELDDDPAEPSAKAIAEVCVGSNLTVTKNVVTELTRSYAYTIDKSASGTTVNVNPVTGKAIVGYTVLVTEGAATDSNWVMSGEITVTNPNDWDVTLDSISDVYDDVPCDVEEGANLLIPKNDARVFDYDCSFGNTKPDYDADNVATIEWDDEEFFTSEGSDDYTVEMSPALWEDVATHPAVESTMTKVNPTVTIVDNKTVPGQSITLGTVTWSAANTKHTFTYSLQLQGSAGRCIPYTNTARISETGQSDSATVTVCWPVSPTVSKTATGTYDRTYLWAIDKEADQTSVETDGQTGTEVNYTVTATPDGYVDDGWAMSGTITVSNPNDFQSMTVDITDMPNIGGGASCAVLNGDDVIVPAGTVVNGQVVPGTATRTYTCTIPQQPLYTGGTNSATITWAGGSASSGALPVVFAVDEETDDVVTVVDDKTVEGDEVELGEATWNDEDEPTVFTYSLDLEAEANECVDYVNTAEILETGQFVDVTVEACGPEVLPDEVIVPRPKPEIKGVETVLPDTGGPQLGLTWAAFALLLAGGALIASSRTRRSRT